MHDIHSSNFHSQFYSRENCKMVRRVKHSKSSGLRPVQTTTQHRSISITLARDGSVKQLCKVFEQRVWNECVNEGWNRKQFYPRLTLLACPPRAEGGSTLSAIRAIHAIIMREKRRLFCSLRISLYHANFNGAQNALL